MLLHSSCFQFCCTAACWFVLCFLLVGGGVIVLVCCVILVILERMLATNTNVQERTKIVYEVPTQSRGQVLGVLWLILDYQVSFSDCEHLESGASLWF